MSLRGRGLRIGDLAGMRAVGASALGAKPAARLAAAVGVGLGAGSSGADFVSTLLLRAFVSSLHTPPGMAGVRPSHIDGWYRRRSIVPLNL